MFALATMTAAQPGNSSRRYDSSRSCHPQSPGRRIHSRPRDESTGAVTVRLARIDLSTRLMHVRATGRAEDKRRDAHPPISRSLPTPRSTSEGSFARRLGSTGVPCTGLRCPGPLAETTSEGGNIEWIGCHDQWRMGEGGKASLPTSNQLWRRQEDRALQQRLLHRRRQDRVANEESLRPKDRR